MSIVHFVFLPKVICMVFDLLCKKKGRCLLNHIHKVCRTDLSALFRKLGSNRSKLFFHITKPRSSPSFRHMATSVCIRESFAGHVKVNVTVDELIFVPHIHWFKEPPALTFYFQLTCSLSKHTSDLAFLWWVKVSSCSNCQNTSASGHEATQDSSSRRKYGWGRINMLLLMVMFIRKERVWFAKEELIVESH